MDPQSSSASYRIEKKWMEALFKALSPCPSFPSLLGAFNQGFGPIRIPLIFSFFGGTCRVVFLSNVGQKPIEVIVVGRSCHF